MDTKKTMALTMRVDEEIFKTLNAVATQDRRTLSDVARLLLERGVTAYRRDGELFEGYKPGPDKPSRKQKIGTA